MTIEESVRVLIEQNLESFVARGIARKPGDADACLRYWQGIALAEQQLFETLLREGNFAGSAAEMVEMLAGREKPQGEQRIPVTVGRCAMTYSA